MIDWKPIDTAPRDGSHVLLLARPRAHPPEPDSLVPIIGFFQRSPVERWMSLDGEDLFATHWTQIPKPSVEG